MTTDIPKVAGIAGIMLKSADAEKLFGSPACNINIKEYIPDIRCAITSRLR
jgi:hypothetical protein